MCRQQRPWEASDNSGAGQDENTHSRGGIWRLRARDTLRSVPDGLSRHFYDLHDNSLRISLMRFHNSNFPSIVYFLSRSSSNDVVLFVRKTDDESVEPVTHMP